MMTYIAFYFFEKLMTVEARGYDDKSTPLPLTKSSNENFTRNTQKSELSLTKIYN